MQDELHRVTSLCGKTASTAPISTGKRTHSGVAKASSSARSASSSTATARVVMLETSDVHGPHFRVTKKHSAQVLKVLTASSTENNKANLFIPGAGGGKSNEGPIVISTQRAGTLFSTPQVLNRILLFYIIIILLN